MKTLRKLKDKCLTLKPEKSQGIVLVNSDDYSNSRKCLFNDTSKFQIFDHDPPIRNPTVESYSNTLCKRYEITPEDKNAMRPKFAQVGREHELSKIHKN